MIDSKSGPACVILCLAIVFCLSAGALEAGQVELLSRSNPPSDTSGSPVTEDAANNAVLQLSPLGM